MGISYFLLLPFRLIISYLSLFTYLYFYIFFIPYAIGCYFLVKHIMKQTQKYRVITEDKKETHEKYNHLKRLDANYWDEKRFIFGALFFAWLKVPLAIIVIISCWISLKISLRNINPDCEIKENHRNRIILISNIFARALLFVLGIVYIHDEYPSVDYTEYLGENYDKSSKAVTNVSNHTSWLDILLFMSKLSPGFISKAAVRDYPLVGYIARCLGCIFVKRTEKGDRNQVINQVIEKQNAIQEGNDSSSLLIFSEGTTSNGSSVLPFKKGAFLSNLPVKPYLILLNKGELSLAMDVIEMLYHIFIVICNPYFTVTLMHFPVICPNEYLYTKSKFADEKKEKWEVYAEAVRDVMVRTGNLEKSNLTYEDKMTYLQFLRGNKDE